MVEQAIEQIMAFCCRVVFSTALIGQKNATKNLFCCNACQIQEFAGSSMETTSNSTFGLMYLDGMLLRFLDASAWTFSTGKEPNISVLTTFVSIAVKLSQVKHYAQIIMLMNELLKVYNTTKSFLSFA
ncbi:hypothetical protein E1A91_A12G227000v1 [Gossypium mustelinum]|uniref:Uncharacterized protein n=1 Tax=Gossypium mustelinum TaxID=34275 RepID=A0A5D2WXQ9_GOSMU|nr:hypothetical protein E1A91_A12G227000v1 [Gossypium mustelinum]